MTMQPSSKKTVFVSGAAGFLGSHCAEQALKLGLRVIAADNFSSGRRENVPEGAEFHEYDLQDLGKNRELLKGVDIVFHAAALPYDNLSLYSPYQITQSVFGLTASLLSAAIHNKVRRFVFCSSMSRYGDQSAPFREDMTPRPVTPYGIAKLAAENLLANLAKVYGFECVIAVFHNVFGPRQAFNDPYRNAVSLIAQRMIQDKPPVVYGDGEQKRRFTPIKDLIPVFAPLFFSEKAAGQTFNIGPAGRGAPRRRSAGNPSAGNPLPLASSGEPNLGGAPRSGLQTAEPHHAEPHHAGAAGETSDDSKGAEDSGLTVNQLTALLNRILGKRLKPLYVKSRPQEVREAFCDNSKARRLLNYRPQTSFEEALRELVASIQEAGPKDFSYSRALEIQSDKIPSAYSKKLF